MSQKLRILILSLLLIALLIFPLLQTGAFVATISIFTLIFAAAAVSWNIFSGNTGYLSLGHATYYGLGAYLLAIFCRNWSIPGGFLPFLLLPLVALIVSCFALILGWIALHTRQFVFVVLTIAFLFIFQVLAYNLPALTQGGRGFYFPTPPWDGDSYNTPFYYVALLLLLLAFALSWWVRRSKYGLVLLAIRDDELRARGLGIHTERYKLSAYVLSAAPIGMAGALGGYYLGFISPPFAFSPVFDVSIALMAFFGGVGTLAGPILGALFLEPLQQFLTIQFDISGLDLVLFGALLLLVILFLPEGVLPSLSTLLKKRRLTTWRKLLY